MGNAHVEHRDSELAGSQVDPGFRARRVTRPNPMLNWSPEQQREIKEDFDALLRELMREHKDPESRALDNQYATTLDSKFRADEAEGRRLIERERSASSLVRGAFLLGRSRFAQFCLGHEVLHGSYATHENPTFQGKNGWPMPLFIVDEQWQHGHNRFHHKAPGVLGLDPESAPTNQRVSTDFYAEGFDRIGAPISAFVLTFHSLFMIGVVEAKKYAEIDPNAWRQLLTHNRELARYEFVTRPLRAGWRAPRVLAGNLLSFLVAELISGALGRTTHIRDDAVCLHVDEFDPSDRAHFYINSLLNAGNVDYPFDRSYIGGFEKHIEHHLFPFLSSRKLEAASERVRALCEKHDLPYREGTLGKIIWQGLKLNAKLAFAA